MENISAREHEIILLVRSIGYGELLEVHTEDNRTGTQRVELSPAEKNLVAQCREYSFLDRVIIHQNDPAFAEVVGEQYGIKYRKKIKL